MSPAISKEIERRREVDYSIILGGQKSGQKSIQQWFLHNKCIISGFWHVISPLLYYLKNWIGGNRYETPD